MELIGYTDTMNLKKICSTCSKEFEATSRHRSCPSCRYHASKTLLCQVCNLNKHSKRYSTCRHCTNKLRSDYGTGRYLKNGYVMVFQKDHPRTKNKRSNYVFEHILVMEKQLGRYLKSDENVHHINGIKNDNRITNLELWVKPQPSGIRVQDAVAWAREILVRYDNYSYKNDLE